MCDPHFSRTFLLKEGVHAAPCNDLMVAGLTVRRAHMLYVNKLIRFGETSMQELTCIVPTLV